MMYDYKPQRTNAKASQQDNFQRLQNYALYGGEYIRTRTMSNKELQKIIAETLTKALTESTTTVDICFLGLSGEMETMTANFGGISATAVAESVMNNRWSEIEDLVFEEV